MGKHYALSDPSLSVCRSVCVCASCEAKPVQVLPFRITYWLLGEGTKLSQQMLTCICMCVSLAAPFFLTASCLGQGPVMFIGKDCYV